MISALLMGRRLVRTVRVAVRDEDFGPVLAAGVSLIALGTAVYALGSGWNVFDSFYFAVSTLTTTNVANPHLVIHDRWLEIFTAFYILLGIGILVEIARRLGLAFIEVRRRRNEKARRLARRSAG